MDAGPSHGPLSSPGRAGAAHKCPGRSPPPPQDVHSIMPLPPHAPHPTSRSLHLVHMQGTRPLPPHVAHSRRPSRSSASCARIFSRRAEEISPAQMQALVAGAGRRGARDQSPPRRPPRMGSASAWVPPPRSRPLRRPRADQSPAPAPTCSCLSWSATSSPPRPRPTSWATP